MPSAANRSPTPSTRTPATKPSVPSFHINAPTIATPMPSFSSGQIRALRDFFATVEPTSSEGEATESGVEPSEPEPTTACTTASPPGPLGREIEASEAEPEPSAPDTASPGGKASRAEPLRAVVEATGVEVDVSRAVVEPSRVETAATGAVVATVEPSRVRGEATGVGGESTSASSAAGAFMNVVIGVLPPACVPRCPSPPAHACVPRPGGCRAVRVP